MESAESEVVYTVRNIEVDFVDQDPDNHWNFILMGNRFWTGILKPHLNVGDRVRITITKEPNALPLNPPLV